MDRPDWDSYFLGIARAVATRADCRRAQHGAVVVQNRRVVSTGYNGGPSGGPSCLAGECPRGLSDVPGHSSGNHDYSDCIALHAEANAIAYAAHAETAGATLYATGAPCDMCSKLARAAGIATIIWPYGERVFGLDSVAVWAVHVHTGDGSAYPVAVFDDRAAAVEWVDTSFFEEVGVRQEILDETTWPAVEESWTRNADQGEWTIGEPMDDGYMEWSVVKVPVNPRIARDVPCQPTS